MNYTIESAAAALAATSSAEHFQVVHRSLCDDDEPNGEWLQGYDTMPEATEALRSRSGAGETDLYLVYDDLTPEAELTEGRYLIYHLDGIDAARQAPTVTIESIARETGWPIIDECLVPEPNMWHADDGNAEIVEEHDSAGGAAQSYVDGGDWGDGTATCWVKVWTWRMGINADGDIVQIGRDSQKITVEPDEPECVEGQEHDWQSPQELVGGCDENPGVYGSGGGVTIYEVCMICGCGKVTDTWAQDPNDGEQGLTSTEYRPREFAEEIKRRKMVEVREYIESHEDGDVLDDEDLMRIFRLAYGHDPSDADRETGLWSLICAAV